jgi:hypothetical protein
VYKDFPVDRLEFKRAKNGAKDNDDDEKDLEELKNILD